MTPDPAAEARLFARLSLKGVLSRTDVQELFDETARSREAGKPVSLSALAIKRGLIGKARLALYFRTDGEDVPPIPGHDYLCKLGEGGTACVFRVRARDGATWAVKILKPELAGDRREVKAFLTEADLLKRLEHPNVAKGHKAGRLGETYLFLMEDIDGRTLQEAIAEGGAFDEDGALYVILQVARALEYLRTEDVVHQDIKPGNIMVTAENEVKLIDLGFATPKGEDGGGEEATARGTAAFLSPEQARGQQDLDVRSDIYSLGATLYQMVLGELPFEGDDETLVQQAVLAGLSAEATKGGRISAHMHYFIETMMAKDRGVRYQDPQELIADIEQQIQGKKSLDIDTEATEEDDAEVVRRRIERLRRMRKRRR
jgi:serine/threonine protein kinase